MPKYYVATGPKVAGIRRILNAENAMEAAAISLLDHVRESTGGVSLGDAITVSEQGMVTAVSEMHEGDTILSTPDVISACDLGEQFGLA